MSANGLMTLKLKIWRQKDSQDKGQMADYVLHDVSPDMSFLEMIDKLNEELVGNNEEPVAFDHDCREGICGMCSLMINGQAHGPQELTTTCQLHMRKFKDGDEIIIEPWRAKALPVIKDLVVDRTAFDDIIASGGYISANTGNAPDGNAIPISKEKADLAMDAAACIGCAACVAACPNSSAMLFVGAKISHMGNLPQGELESKARTISMVNKMDELGFGNCSNHAECEASCPKGISLENISHMNCNFISSSFTKRD
jgi:succinate dehydrogenase / fumarate reductase iron-sulfur subunit